MSWDINIVHPDTGEALQNPAGVHQVRGGTYCVGGTSELYLNVTYNYATLYHRVLGWGLSQLDGQLVADTLNHLAKGVAALGTETDPDYWQPAEGNARAALCDLLSLAAMAPHGRWSVS